MKDFDIRFVISIPKVLQFYIKLFEIKQGYVMNKVDRLTFIELGVFIEHGGYDSRINGHHHDAHEKQKSPYIEIEKRSPRSDNTHHNSNDRECKYYCQAQTLCLRKNENSVRLFHLMSIFYTYHVS
jgi:hypothetical protein